jgi:hypothetical protein
MLLISVINSVDSLLTNIFRIAFPVLPLKPLLVISIGFHGLVLVFLIFILISIIRQTNHDTPRVVVSLKTLQIIGILSITIVLAAAALRLYFKTNFHETLDLSKISYTDTTELATLTLTQTGLTFLRNIVAFISFFLIIYKQK